MTFTDDIKVALRISADTMAFDGEISDLIFAARRDLMLSGVAQDKTNDDTDPLIKRAIVVYAKANFGYDNPDADKLQRSYDSLKQHLSLASDYNGSAGDTNAP